VYFKNLTTADGTKIFDDSLYASLGYSLRDTFFEKNIKYLMNIDPASVKASDFQLLIESVQNGEMPTTALRLLTSSAEINPDLQSDLSMLCEVIVKNKNKETLSAELLDAYISVVQSQSSIMPNIKIGDAFLVEGEECVRIKTSDMTSELTDITRETYYKLFPPLERFSATQMNLNNCYLIEPIMLLYSQPNTRFNIVKMFSENLQTGEITVKLNDLVDGITFPPQFVGNKNFSNGLIASQMIQEVYGQSIETNAIQTTSLPKGIYFRNQKIVGNTSSEVNVGNTGYFDDVFNNFGIFDISFVEPKSNNELEKILATIENNKKFAMCAISGHAYGLVCENGKYYLYNPYCQAMPEVFESIEEFIKKHSLETITHIYL